MTSILLFSAGLGTRMRPLTDERPKPMVEVAGQSLFDHAAQWTDSELVTKRVANTSYKAKMMGAHAQKRGFDISYEPEPLETGGGLLNALPLMPGSPVFTMNTDAVWRGGHPLEQLSHAWADHMDGLLLLVPLERAWGHSGSGDFVLNAQSQVMRKAKAAQDASAEAMPLGVYTGAQLIRPECIGPDMPKRFSLNEVWDQMIARGCLYGCLYTGAWCDVGQPSSIAIAEQMLQAKDIHRASTGEHDA